ncbi:MAG: hypothetical protein IJ466_00970 [Clostridia bacterium]|nr:hypothetical protein [Clostridia bacterium]
MFGYVITNCKTLSDAERARFRAMYCGMCHTLKRRYGNLGRFTLSYDMTFVAMVLSGLYEPQELSGSERCMPHMLKPHDYVLNSIMEYAVDMNIALAYHKCADNWQDDKNPVYAAAKQALKGAYRKACALHPEKCRAIEEWMRGVGEIEKSGREEIDPPMNLTGRMLGTLFQYRDDFFSEALFRMGDGLGRFIYFMDAYDDLEKDVKRKKYNPLKSIMGQSDYEEICKDAMTMALADCAAAFEELPVIQDAQLIRNILYSGVWAKYGYIQTKKAEKQAKVKGAQ